MDRRRVAVHIPPTVRWTVYYKFCAKGVPKDAKICPVLKEQDTILFQEWQDKLRKHNLTDGDQLAGDNLYTFQCIKFCVKKGVPLRSIKDKIERHLDSNTSTTRDKRYSMYHTTLERTILNHPWAGREKFFRTFSLNQDRKSTRQNSSHLGT